MLEGEIPDGEGLAALQSNRISADASDGSSLPQQGAKFIRLAGATSGWGLVFALSSYSAPLGESEQQTIDIRGENEEPY